MLGENCFMLYNKDLLENKPERKEYESFTNQLHARRLELAARNKINTYARR